MKSSAFLPVVQEIMTRFARSTGLSTSANPPRRYLWTDAFAVCNFLELFGQTGEDSCLQLAVDLADQVHHVLGRHRGDDRRTGWISGLDEEEAREHPTKGGLRIGKKINERAPSDPYDERLEWDRDGQYYHYLTKWMHALNRLGRVTQEPAYRLWAIELAKSAHAAFTYSFSDGEKRMYWKMRIDLSAPLVPAMGLHDPLDGYVTYKELQARKEELPALGLETEIEDMAVMCKGKDWTTADPLGIGGLLTDAYRLIRLEATSDADAGEILLAEDLLHSSLRGLESLGRDASWSLEPAYRLAFRELGLAIGLQAVERIQARITGQAGLGETPALRERTDLLMGYMPLKQKIVDFWLREENRENPTWKEHGDINAVMLATSLFPDGYLAV